VLDRELKKKTMIVVRKAVTVASRIMLNSIVVLSIFWKSCSYVIIFPKPSS